MATHNTDTCRKWYPDGTSKYTKKKSSRPSKHQTRSQARELGNMKAQFAQLKREHSSLKKAAKRKKSKHSSSSSRKRAKHFASSSDSSDSDN